MRFDFWNTLHDGSIERVTGSVPGDLVLRVGIKYLTDVLPTVEDFLWVHLLGCTRFEMRTFDGDPVESLSEFPEEEVAEIQNVQEVDGVVKVCSCGRSTGGFIHCVYRDAEIRLAEGRLLPQAELEAAAEEYWERWARRGREARERRERGEPPVEEPRNPGGHLHPG